MKSAVVLDGRFRVFEDGSINRIKDGTEEKAKTNKVGREKKYIYVYYRENGKTKSVGVHRLVAQSFIPNPDGKPFVNHKDGEPSNNHVWNLEWVTPSENVQHAHDNWLINPWKKAHPCIYCGALTNAKTPECTRCRVKNVADKIAVAEGRVEEPDHRPYRLKSIAEMYESCDDIGLTKSEKKFLAMAKTGMRIKDIADETGFTKQWVSACLLNVQEKKGIKKWRNIRKQNQNRLYDIIEGLCKEKGVSVAVMCRDAKIRPGLLSDLKNQSTATLSMDSLRKVADYFQIQMDVLFDRKV